VYQVIFNPPMVNGYTMVSRILKDYQAANYDMRGASMLGYEMIILIGLVGGIAVGIQSPLVGAMGQRIGGMASSVVIHLGGLLLSIFLLMIRGGGKIRDWSTLPWYMLVAGCLGVLLIQTINITLPRLGATKMLTLIISGQLLTGVVLDTFGWLGMEARPIDINRLIGVMVLLVGGYLVIK
jgi:transporter family-2 protein